MTFSLSWVVLLHNVLKAVHLLKLYKPIFINNKLHLKKIKCSTEHFGFILNCSVMQRKITIPSVT
jgi:hypothetical protein